MSKVPPDPVAEWREISREPVGDYRIFTVERSVAVSPVDGQPRTFHRIQSPTWTQIVPITSDGHVVMIRQYRHGAQRVTLEIPGGLVDLGEDPAQAAMRECLEETGYRAREVESLGVVNPNPALFANRLYGYLATGVEREGGVQNTGTEFTEPVLVPVRKLRGMLESGEIDHALVANTLWRYLYLHGPR
jgi:8-oxo-dGTP pyrophosphatase MutT (NUDIX family)